jgi:hypothetical protein
VEYWNNGILFLTSFRAIIPPFHYPRIPVFPYSNGKQALYSIKKGRMER